MAPDLSLCAALAASVITGSAAPYAFASESGRSVVSTREHAVERLGARATVLVREQRLADAVAAVSAATGLKIVPRWTDEFGAEAIDPEHAVWLDLVNASAATIIERLTAAASSAATADIAWQITAAGEVELGPKSVLNRHRRTRIYDVRDLVAHVPDFDEAAEIDLDAALAQTGGDGGGGVLICFPDEYSRPSAESRTDELVGLICATIEPEQWTHLGGDGATIRRHGGSIVIVAPDYIHRQIAGLTRD